MKLYIFLLFCSIGLVQATNSYAQKATVNLKMQNQTVQTVLNEIENQSEFSFFFNTKHVDLQRRVTITVKDSDIFRVLAYIIHSGFISGYQNRYGDNLKPPTNVYHRMTA